MECLRSNTQDTYCFAISIMMIIYLTKSCQTRFRCKYRSTNVSDLFDSDIRCWNNISCDASYLLSFIEYEMNAFRLDRI